MNEWKKAERDRQIEARAHSLTRFTCIKGLRHSMRWYEELVEQVIRPPRAAYDESADLKGGHSGEFELQGRRYRRDDFEVGVCIYI